MPQPQVSGTHSSGTLMFLVTDPNWRSLRHHRRRGSRTDATNPLGCVPQRAGSRGIRTLSRLSMGQARLAHSRSAAGEVPGKPPQSRKKCESEATCCSRVPPSRKKHRVNRRADRENRVPYSLLRPAWARLYCPLSLMLRCRIVTFQVLAAGRDKGLVWGFRESGP